MGVKLARSFIILLMVITMLPVGARAFLIDRVAAVVNQEVITESEVDRAVRSEAQRRGITGADALKSLRNEALESIIDRKLILSDARRFNIVDVTDKEVDDALAKVKARYPSEDAFKRALAEEDMSLDELRENLAEQILAVKYVDRRVRFFVRVTLDDQKRYYQEHAVEFGGKSFTEVHDEIHDLLMEKYTNEKLEQYIKDLRSRADITINPPPDEKG
jgi:peptidyl-prolyl cis-trans isomerase SurA